MPVESPDDLYGLPLERFVEERTTLVKALRAQKQTEEATRVGALKKPTVAAWAVNQLVRSQPKAIKALFQAGDDLASALSGGRGGAAQIRDATQRQREALADLLGAGEGLLTGEGRELGAATLERVSETLRAAAIDPQAREQVSRGCLDKELQASGWLVPEPAAAPPPPSPGAAKGDKDSARELKRAQQAARKKSEQAAKQLATAQIQRRAAASEVDEAQRAVDTAQATLARAKAGLRKADEVLASAETRAKAAACALDSASRPTRSS